MDAKLLEHFKKQIKFLKNSCKLYDDGDLDEAIRIATILRVLMYDTGSSTSLLKQMGIKDSYKILTQSSSLNISGEIYHLNMGLIKDGVLQPNFGKGVIQKIIVVDDWLKQNVAVMDENTKITKLDLIKAAAHKDGGAHVDMNEPDNYKKIKECGIDEIQHFVALRQMGYEFLVSIEENENLKAFV